MTTAVLFGSRVRGDNDVWSDLDLLLLHDFGRGTTEDRAWWRATGCSITEYSWKRAESQARFGSLFLRHVMSEGEVVGGDSARFAELGSLWIPRRNYDQEIDANLSLIEHLSKLPKNDFGPMLAADLIATLFRSVVIRKLANEGEYVFSWKGVMAGASRFLGVSSRSARCFRYLRYVKNAYRSGRILRVDSEAIDVGSALLGEIGKIRTKTRFMKRRDIERFSLSFPSNSYRELRALELVCGAYGMDCGLSDVVHYVRNPSYFITR